MDVSRQPAGTGPASVLLVESNPAISEGLRSLLLRDFAGCRVDTAATTALAAQCVHDCRPAIVLVDIDCRQIVRFDTLGLLRSLVGNAPLVALSRYPVHFFRESAIDAGADACACIAQAEITLCDVVRRMLHEPSQGSG